ncbi:MAG: cytochrome P450 [Actinomycetota bacterium]
MAQVVSQLEMPVVDYHDPGLSGERFHEVLGELSRRSWLARTDIGFLVLDRDASIELLRDHRLSFPAIELLMVQGVTDGPVHERTVKGLMTRSGEPHLRLRRLIAPALSPRALARVRENLHAILERCWERVAAAGRTEFVAGFAQPIPSMVIAELLGVPGDDERLARWSILLQAVFKLNMEEDRVDIERAYEEVRSYVLELLEERRRSPGSDFISVIGTYDEGGDRLSDEECVTLVSSVISGGTDTTQAQLAHGMRLFAEHPDQWRLLAERPELAERAANEVLRFEPITPFTARIVQEEIEYRGVTFPVGTLVFACAATANRDRTAFERPDDFDIAVERGRTPVLTFGFGDHFCLGARLARMELADTFAFLAPRMRDLRPAGEPRFGSIIGIYAMESLPLAFDAG